MSRREVMAARAITRQRATRAAAASLDPSSPARFHDVKLALARDTPATMIENPNRGKRHAARMTDAFQTELARAEIASRRPNYSGAGRVPTKYRTQIAGTRRVRNARGILVPFESPGYSI